MAVLKEAKTWKRTRKLSAVMPVNALAPEERENVVRALHVMRIRYRSWGGIAKALGISVKAVDHAVSKGGKPSVGMALRLARAAGVTVEDVLAGKWPAEGCCPMCGQAV